MPAATVELPPRNNCRRGNNCLIHLHSAAGHAYLLRHIIPFHSFEFPDGIPRFRVIENHQETYQTKIEILASHLMNLKQNAQILDGELYEKAIVVLPATLRNLGRHSDISLAAYLAGFNSLVFLDRAVIASYNHSMSSTEPKKYFTFELGDGILEISLLTPLLKVRSSIAGTGCPLYDVLIYVIRNTIGIDISGDWLAMVALRKACELAKDDLCSGESTAALYFFHRNKSVSFFLTGEELVMLNLRLLRVCIRRCLMMGRAGQGDVDEVILAGDSTDIPEIRRVIRDFFPHQTIRFDTDIEDCAAQVADRLSTNEDTRPFLPLLDIFNMGDFFFY
ncbi:hypothetical protein KSP40_PGU010194 [Platanthera guangdongensis]|uniref:Uncharacterized protein n=1 Tax=Platanthera guangdongensis TaxID=2320717 RepID=A0ABR2MXW9_9ASPA